MSAPLWYNNNITGSDIIITAPNTSDIYALSIYKGYNLLFLPDQTIYFYILTYTMYIDRKKFDVKFSLESGVEKNVRTAVGRFKASEKFTGPI